MLTEGQAQTIERAVGRAERTTSSEIAVCVLGASADDRGIAAIAGALVFALVEIVGTSIWWNLNPLIWLGIALAAGVLVFWLCDHFDLGLRCLPARLVIKDARRAARAVFMDHGLDNSAERSAVLLFVSRAERYVEILPDRGAAAAIAAVQWAVIVDEFRQQMRGGDLGETMAGAIAKIGALCAAHFPVSDDNPDRVPNRPIQD